MEKPKYLTMEELFLKIDEPYRSQCWKIYLDNLELFHVVQGSTNNHQNWRGGYHDHIVEVLDFGWTRDGAAYLVMEFLAGQTLAERLALGPSRTNELGSLETRATPMG